MKKRSVAAVIILSLVTFGIYYMVWVYKTRKEMVAKGQSIPTFWLLFAPVLILVLIGFLQFFVRFVLSQSASPDAGPNDALYRGVSVFSSLAGVLAVLAIFPATIYFFYKYCKAVEAVTRGSASFGFTFGLWAVLTVFSLAFVWPGLIQDSFNKLADTPPTGPLPPAPSLVDPSGQTPSQPASGTTPPAYGPPAPTAAQNPQTSGPPPQTPGQTPPAV
jgi:Domain of unknown function (DUF4234)